tara:strand:+ start:74408 stop:75001 length:594 start_codon:yes stop_codon:yes gene_type:complete
MKHIKYIKENFDKNYLIKDNIDFMKMVLPIVHYMYKDILERTGESWVREISLESPGYEIVLLYKANHWENKGLESIKELDEVLQDMYNDEIGSLEGFELIFRMDYTLNNDEKSFDKEDVNKNFVDNESKSSYVNLIDGINSKITLEKVKVILDKLSEKYEIDQFDFDVEYNNVTVYFDIRYSIDDHISKLNKLFKTI